MREILFISATHGNERFSVAVMEEMQRTYDPAKYGYDWIIGNPLALEKGTRFVDKDLNRSAPGNPESQYYEGRRAAEIIRLSQKYDAVIDIHGSVAECGIVTIVPYPTAENLALAKSIPVKRSVVWYAEESAVSGPLTQHMLCPAVEIECGPQSGEAIKNELRETIGSIIVANLTGEDISLANQELYSVYGVKLGEPDDTIKDFQEVSRSGERFYPFLSANQYPGTVCYKLKRATEEEVLL